MSEYTNEGISFFRGKEIIAKKNGKNINEKLYISEEKYNGLKDKFGVPQKGDILLTAVGTIGVSYFVDDEDFYFKDGNILWLKNFNITGINYYIYDYMQSTEFMNKVNSITIGSTQKALTIQEINKITIMIPEKETLHKYVSMSKSINNIIKLNIKENCTLEMSRDALLPKLMNGEIDLSNISLEE